MTSSILPVFATRAACIFLTSSEYGVTLTTVSRRSAMPKAQAVAFLAEDLVGWERALVAFLVEKERRSGSKRTVQGYSSMLQDFFGRAQLPPDQVTPQQIFAWAPWSRGFRQGPLSYHHRGPHGLPEFLLPVPHPHGDGERQSLRQAGAAEDRAVTAEGVGTGRDASATGRDPRHSSRHPQPRYHPHPGPHRTAQRRSVPASCG